MTELEAANQKEKEASEKKEARKEQDIREIEDSETETEAIDDRIQGVNPQRQDGRSLKPEDSRAALRKRTSSREASSGDLSTDSEWDKVSEAGDLDR